MFYLRRSKMVDQYNEASQLRVRLAILESQLKVANRKVEHLEKIHKDAGSPTKPSQSK